MEDNICNFYRKYRSVFKNFSCLIYINLNIYKPSRKMDKEYKQNTNI